MRHYLSSNNEMCYGIKTNNFSPTKHVLQYHNCGTYHNWVFVWPTMFQKTVFRTKTPLYSGTECVLAVCLFFFFFWFSKFWWLRHNQHHTKVCFFFFCKKNVVRDSQSAEGKPTTGLRILEPSSCINKTKTKKRKEKEISTWRWGFCLSKFHGPLHIHPWRPGRYHESVHAYMDPKVHARFCICITRARAALCLPPIPSSETKAHLFLLTTKPNYCCRSSNPSAMNPTKGPNLASSLLVPF